MSDRRAFSVAVFARHRGRILLILHKRLGTWLPVGGEIETGETPSEAAVRELREETGLVGSFRRVVEIDGTPDGYLGYEEHRAGSKGLHMNFAFVADVENDAVSANEEFDRYRWVDDPGRVECPINVRELGRMALHGGADPNVGLARAWLAAFNARDLDRLLSLYSEDATHASPRVSGSPRGSPKGGPIRGRAGGPELRGKPALRDWWQEAFARLPGLRYDERQITTAPERFVVEYDRVVAGEPTTRVAVSCRTREARIVASRVFHA